MGAKRELRDLIVFVDEALRSNGPSLERLPDCGHRVCDTLSDGSLEFNFVEDQACLRCQERIRIRRSNRRVQSTFDRRKAAACKVCNRFKLQGIRQLRDLIVRDDWAAIRKTWQVLKERLEFKSESLERKIRFDDKAQTIVWLGKKFELSPKQYTLLSILRKAKGALLTRAEINKRSDDQFGGPNAVRNVLNDLGRDFKELRACVQASNAGFAFQLRSD